MTLLFDVNNVAMTGPQAMYKMKQLLVSAGWAVKSSGDGLSAFSSSGDIITSGNAVANGLANSGAWFRIQSPLGASSREFVVQRSFANTVWTINYSFSAGFTGGSPNSSTLPTATDSQALATTTSIFTTDNTYHWNAAADNAAPYGFYSFSYNFGGNGVSNAPTSGAWFMDPLTNTSASDQDPTIHYVSTSTSYTASISSNVLGYLKKGLAGEGFVNVPWAGYQSAIGNIIFPSGAGTDIYSNQIMLLPIIYARPTSQSSPVGYKGVSSLFKYHSTLTVTPTVISISTPKDYILIADIAMKWNGSDLFL